MSAGEISKTGESEELFSLLAFIVDEMLLFIIRLYEILLRLSHVGWIV